MQWLDTLKQYWHTVSHLRPEQIGGQVWVRMQPLRRVWDILTQPDPGSYPGCTTQTAVPWLPPPSGDNSPAAITAGTLAFLREPHHIGWPPQWLAPDRSKLWQYNLHYFEWLWLLDLEQATFVVQNWIEFSQKHPQHPGWQPYPMSLRLMNWCGFFFHRHQQQIGQYPNFVESLWQSLVRQAHWLQHHLEFHLLGNHLFENAACLALLGSQFPGKHAQAWRQTGLTLLQQQLPEQILPDGLHFELSPMYHTRMVYVMLLLSHHGHRDIATLTQPYLFRMLQALRYLCHPDGQIALLNDSAFDIYHHPSALFGQATFAGLTQRSAPTSTAFAAFAGTHGSAPTSTAFAGMTQRSAPTFTVTMGQTHRSAPTGGCGSSWVNDSTETNERVSVWCLPDAGYYGACTANGSYVVCDVGVPGPDYLPGHAHGDLFSFELSLRGHRIVVDSGVHDYTLSDMRRYCRSTRAHNTVEIEHTDQSEFWGAFRVARRAQPHDLMWTHNIDGFTLQAWHDGYLRLPQQARHERRFGWDSSGRLTLWDHIAAAKPVRVVSRLHLHPTCSIVSQTSHQAEVQSPAGLVRIVFAGLGELLPVGTEESWYCPQFGCAQANSVLCFRAIGDNLSFSCTIE